MSNQIVQCTLFSDGSCLVVLSYMPDKRLREGLIPFGPQSVDMWMNIFGLPLEEYDMLSGKPMLTLTPILEFT